MGKYDLTDSNGLAISKRVRFFDGQFLQDQDFIDEQKYQMDRRQRAGRLLHTPGVMEGLGLSLDRSRVTVTVAAGTAQDGQGRLLVVQSALSTSLSGRKAGEDLVLTLSWTERSSDQSAGSYGSVGDTRFTEQPAVGVTPRADWEAALTTTPADQLPVPLGRVQLIQDPADAAKVSFSDASPLSTFRQYAGARLPVGAGAISLHASGDAAPTEATLSGSLAAGGLKIGEGGALVIEAGNSRAAIETRGNSSRIITGSGVFFSKSGEGSDKLPKVRLIEHYGVRYESEATIQPFSTSTAVLVGHTPSGQSWAPGSLFTAGKVGIQRTSADVALHVEGDGRLSGTLKVGSLQAEATSDARGRLIVEAPTANGHRVSGQGNLTGLNLRQAGAPADQDPILQIQSEGKQNRFFVEHNGWTGARDNSAWFGGAQPNYFASNVGLGTTAPTSRLDVAGALTFNGAARQRISGAVVDSHDTVVVSGAFNDLRIKGRVIDWTGGDLQIGYSGESLQSKVRVKANTFVVDAPAVVNGSLSFNDVNRQSVNLFSTTHGVGVQTSTTYFRSSNHFAWFKGGAHNDAALNPGTGGAALMALKDGNLGIGTDAPGSRLTANGDISLGITPADETTQTDSTGRKLFLRGVADNGTSTWVRRHNLAGGGAQIEMNVGATGALAVGNEPSGGSFAAGLKIGADGGVMVGAERPFVLLYYQDFIDQKEISGYPESQWVCTVAGFRSGSGDIDENDDNGSAILQVYCYTSNGKWYVRADFKSHSDQHENWDVWILAINRKWISVK